MESTERGTRSFDFRGKNPKCFQLKFRFRKQYKDKVGLCSQLWSAKSVKLLQVKLSLSLSVDVEQVGKQTNTLQMGKKSSLSSSLQLFLSNTLALFFFDAVVLSFVFLCTLCLALAVLFVQGSDFEVRVKVLFLPFELTLKEKTFVVCRERQQL